MRPEEYKIEKEKFTLVNEDKKLHDKELVTKPVGFFKDAMHRFSRNKGSIVGAVVIAILVLYAIIAPIFSQYSVSYHDEYYSFTLPKFFDSENIDFLDGAKNETGNISTFINEYSKGLETGHNAIKRLSYKYDEETEMYSYRLDSYYKVGTVFKIISRDDYLALQDYQDATGQQIIYPITDVTKRPKKESNAKDASYWYKTEFVDGSDIPADYVIKEDGTVELKNIYKEYSVPIVFTKTDVAKAAFINLEKVSGGYAMKATIVENAGKENETLKVMGYYKATVEREIDTAIFVDTIEEASVFVYDNTYKTFKTLLQGHKDTLLDGYYFFGLKTLQGSTANLLHESYLTSNEYIPFTLRNMEDGSLVDLNESTDLTKNYLYAAHRHNEYPYKVFVASYVPIDSTFKEAAKTFDSGASVKLEEAEGGYKISIALSSKDASSRAAKILYYLSAKVDEKGNNSFIFNSAKEKDLATVWQYEKETGSFKTHIGGHQDASLDNDYYFGINVVPELNGSNYNFTKSSSFALFTKEQLKDETVMNKAFRLCTDKNLEPVEEIDTSKQYKLGVSDNYIIDSTYYFNGGFNGDNYLSDMRIEGKGVHEYDYAIAKDGDMYEIRISYYDYYRYYHSQVLKDGIDKPYFLFGTTSSGQDIFTCLASGARFSFALAIVVATVNLIVGAIYGAIEGYYGGKVDMIMERIVEILSAVPFMIVITLLKYHMGGTKQFIILFIAFFLTGWIGMSGTVRMQFYRFKNQEYVLASRTLGAKDVRIMFKHIFPNALGTIVTSCVLVIPGMIFSETSLSYLGIINLNTGDMTSVGTLLAQAQPFLVQYPHMILFPSIFISLLMLCFNLFGNGLRDAFNPSLRGTED